MLIVQYNVNDAIADNEFHGWIDSENWNYFKYEVYEALHDLEFPITLIAERSNWRGETGYAEATDIGDLLVKLTNFGSSYYELHKENDNYEFHLSTHDVPTGFSIKIQEIS